MPAETVLQHLNKVRSTGPGRWLACCPAHEDRSPSLSIRETDDGTILLKCFAGCNVAEIVGAVGLSLSDLFPETVPSGTHSQRPNYSPIQRHELWDVLENDLVALSIAWADVSRGVEFSPEDALFMSQKANELADILMEVRSER
jgi:hypothetical protein